MNITGVTIKAPCVLDCGQAAKPGDHAMVFEFVMRNHAVAAYYMQQLIEEGLDTLARQPLPSPPEKTSDKQ